ncbi:Lysophosphatidic acid:oleoyl-CoA acyltransferase 1 [Rhizina undulata]
MEKFSQYRDRGTGIAPFLPINVPRSTFQNVYGVALFLFRLPFFVSVFLSYFLIFHWLPIGSFVRKAWLWSILGCGGVWWVDLQVEGVKKGSLSKQSTKLPTPGTIIVSNYTSPLDVLYLAAVFDSVFTASYSSTRRVEQVSLPTALLRCFSPPLLQPPKGANLCTLSELLSQHPTRTIVVFPEGTTTNGRGILRFTPSLDTAPPQTAVFPLSLRYTPADITTPIPHSYATAVYNLLSRPTHCIRVRIAETLFNDSAEEKLDEDGQSGFCERVAEALARIGRAKRLNLGVGEKAAFVEKWGKS